MKNKKVSKLKGYTYFVRGMHCPSCEILIEKNLLKEKGIEAVEASTGKNEVRIEYFGNRPSIKKLNIIFQKENYIFSDTEIKKTENNNPIFQIDQHKQLIINKDKLYNLLIIVGTSLAVIVGFFILIKSGLAALLSVNSQSSLPAFFIFGMLAGFSTCSALVGGLILSMSKQWLELYPNENSTLQKLKPHLLFNFGRLISFALVGILLGTIGSALRISLTFTSILTLVISIIMIILGLQMLGVKALAKFQITMPKFMTRFVADENNFKMKWMPFLMGAFTFLLPCGFTIATQGLALISGNPLQSGLIMLAFALGTLPALLLIGFSSVKFTQKIHLANRFLKIAGVLVLFFAIYNINSQLNVLGLNSFNDLNFNSNKTINLDNSLPPIVNGKQVIKMDALSFGYEPNKIRVRVGVPVRWEITDKGTSGCTNAIISKDLFKGQIDLTPGTTSIKEFTPQKPGRYKFSCWMGMVSGLIEVVDENSSTGDFDNSEVIESGNTSCGTGCGGGCGGGCGNPGCPYNN